MSLSIQTPWIQTYGCGFDHHFVQVPSEGGLCEKDKGMKTQPETEPAGMPESSLTKLSSLGPNSHQFDHRHLQEDKTASQHTGGNLDKENNKAVHVGDAGSYMGSAKMVETSSAELCGVTDGAKVYFEEDVKENKHQGTTSRSCRITKDGFPDAKEEKDFLESPMALAVKFMSCHSTVGMLLNALTLLRFEASDCGLYPENAKQLLKALDTVGSDDFSAKKFWEDSTEICNKCFDQHRDKSRRDADSNNCCEDEKECEDEGENTGIADCNAPTEEYREHVELSDEETTTPPPVEDETETQNSEEQTSNTIEYEYHEDAEPLVHQIPETAETEKADELNNETRESLPAEDKDTLKAYSSEGHDSVLAEGASFRKEGANLAILTEDIKTAKSEELPQPQKPKLAAKKARFEALLEENKRLRRRQLCRLCVKVPANATLLPCGHLIYCLDCAQSLSHCGACHKEILGDVKTFLS